MGTARISELVADPASDIGLFLEKLCWLPFKGIAVGGVEAVQLLFENYAESWSSTLFLRGEIAYEQCYREWHAVRSLLSSDTIIVLYCCFTELEYLHLYELNDRFVFSVYDPYIFLTLFRSTILLSRKHWAATTTVMYWNLRHSPILERERWRRHLLRVMVLSAVSSMMFPGHASRIGLKEAAKT